MRFALLLVGLVACRANDAPSAPTSSASATETPAPIPSARRPTRRYYLARTASRCELYWLDGAEGATPSPTPCPIELEIGESARVTGKTCTRESADPTRAQPIPCPNALLLYEHDDRARAR